MSDATFKVGQTVRIVSIESCKGKEGPIVEERDAPRNGGLFPSYKVDLGDGVVWCWPYEIERIWRM